MFVTSRPKDLFLSKKSQALNIIQNQVQLIQHEIFPESIGGIGGIYV